MKTREEILEEKERLTLLSKEYKRSGINNVFLRERIETLEWVLGEDK